MPHSDPLAFALQEWIGGYMRSSMRNLILYSKENGLSMSQMAALFQIHHGKSNVSGLGEGLGITHAAASQMLDRLVQQKLILRTEDPQDRRVKKLVLTDKGCRIMQESVRARQDWLEAVLSGLSASQKEQIAAAVKILIEKTNQLDQQPAAQG
ncbi:MAG TPA: MarR family transcriptional regulator [Anaerolineales bacterium]|nr:MarR family transcriptional regulator [Anaerolineales bacterium]